MRRLVIQDTCTFRFALIEETVLHAQGCSKLHNLIKFMCVQTPIKHITLPRSACRWRMSLNFNCIIYNTSKTKDQILQSRGGGGLPSNRLMGMCRWMGSHFHDCIDYNRVAFSLGANRVTRMGSHICGISGVSKFWQVGVWDIFAQK